MAINLLESYFMSDWVDSNDHLWKSKYKIIKKIYNLYDRKIKFGKVKHPGKIKKNRFGENQI